MSSFKRKGLGKQPTLQRGTRISPATSSTIITSTGISSLDDILGGGLPLSCSLLVAAPDFHSSYGELVQKYFVAQGLADGHNICIIAENARNFVNDIMWFPDGIKRVASQDVIEGEDDDNVDQQTDQRIKIAWRYEQMKQFQTTVTSSSPSTEDFCHVFDLTCRAPESVIEDALQSGQLSFLPIQSLGITLWTNILQQITELLLPQSTGSLPSPLRICIPSLGSPLWGDLMDKEILYFLHQLRSLVRNHPHACASISLSPHISTDVWGGSGWTQKLGWLSDAMLTLTAFTANPSLSSIFPSHHGLLHINTLPSPHGLLSPSDRFSVLRGLYSSHVSGGSGENNLAFKCTRKRLIFETLHLDLEGGVGERRTTPSTTAVVESVGATNLGSHSQPISQQKNAAFAAMEVQLEEMAFAEGDSSVKEGGLLDVKPKKQKKSVAFRSDRPELYDF